MGAAASSLGADAPSASPRIEARSADLLAVGVVHGEQLVIHLSRIEDNAPLRDAAVAVVLRGTTHPTTAEADGSYSLKAPDLSLPGAAAVVFEVDPKGGAHEELKGTLQVIAPPDPSNDKGSTRQLGWWVLNFAVCLGFLFLWSRRRKA